MVQRSRFASLLLLAALMSLSCSRAADKSAAPEVRFIASPHEAMKNLPFSEAVRVGTREALLPFSQTRLTDNENRKAGKSFTTFEDNADLEVFEQAAEVSASPPVALASARRQA